MAKLITNTNIPDEAFDTAIAFHWYTWFEQTWKEITVEIDVKELENVKSGASDYDFIWLINIEDENTTEWNIKILVNEQIPQSKNEFFQKFFKEEFLEKAVMRPMIESGVLEQSWQIIQSEQKRMSDLFSVETEIA